MLEKHNNFDSVLITENVLEIQPKSTLLKLM